MATGQVIMDQCRVLITTYVATLTHYMALGIGTTTPTATAGTVPTTEVTSASLGNAQTYTRPTAAITQQQTTVANDTTQWSATWTNPSGSANTIAVTEAAFMSAATTGTPYWWAVFSAMNVAPAYGIQVVGQAAFG